MNERTNQPKTFDLKEWLNDPATCSHLRIDIFRDEEVVALVAAAVHAATAAAQEEIAVLRLNLQSVVKRSETNDEAYRAALRAEDEEIARLREVLPDCITALDDWLNIYALEFCDDKRVAEAHQRVRARGTVAYICDVTTRARAALTAQAEKEKP